MQERLPRRPGHVPAFLTVSTTAVFGRRYAVFTGMDLPLPASRPVLMPFHLTHPPPPGPRFRLTQATDNAGHDTPSAVVAQHSTFQ